MTDLSNQTYCYYCKRELNAGQGRYRFFQSEKEVECCPSCFDQRRAFPQRRFEEAAGVCPAGEPGKNSSDRSDQ